MISLVTARRLKKAGLAWTPTLHDFFAVPDREMDDQIFVISEMLVTVDTLQGEMVILFQGASEWALDSLVTLESIWLPTEEQLRQALEAGLMETGRPEILFTSGLNGCTCTIRLKGEAVRFEASQASEAYAAALLYLLEN
jgi:hypothetical protein